MTYSGFLKSQFQASGPWSVGELTTYIREMFEADYRLRDLEVAGEVSNFLRARSGHLYFTLKDEGAQLKCVMWRTQADRLRFDMGDGDAVVAHGRIGVYDQNGVYQLYADSVAPAGRGNLALAFEELKNRLAGEGLFDPEFKEPIPYFPRKIGVVTSADAAAFRDILNVLHRRFPLVSVLLSPTLVQGDQAPQQIVRSLRWLDGRDDVDTIIIARGGGSLEDLWAFNDEEVARAIFNARHPIISGVGHETDFSIADFVADLRAPTPSAAAELAVPDVVDLRARVVDQRDRLAALMVTTLREQSWQVQSARQNLVRFNPQARLDAGLQAVDSLSQRLDQAVRFALERSRARLELAAAELAAISPKATLTRGYAIVRVPGGRIIRQLSQVGPNQRLEITVADGSFGAVADLEPETGAGKGA
jgi:exodeoxyribonuclease VII large subunit